MQQVAETDISIYVSLTRDLHGFVRYLITFFKHLCFVGLSIVALQDMMLIRVRVKVTVRA